MTKKTEDKGLLNEVLPDPSLAGDLKHGSPRERTARHLRQILAATAAGVSLLASGNVAQGDNSIPPPGGATKPDGKGAKGVKPEQKKHPPIKEPEPPQKPPGYWVVDPMPPPARIIEGAGHLTLTSTPNAEIIIDGEASGTTPMLGFELASGHHVVELRPVGGGPSEVFAIELKKGESLTLKKDLRPKKPVQKNNKGK